HAQASSIQALTFAPPTRVTFGVPSTQRDATLASNSYSNHYSPPLLSIPSHLSHTRVTFGVPSPNVTQPKIPHQRDLIPPTQANVH
ncbi:hypothetical protein PIB30_099550, partial [Stylosanthes scabra]|nr:hypothetical protein [Stylosanthes scabra]